MRSFTRTKRGRLLPALFFLLSGCASFPDAVQQRPDLAQPVELTDTPFYPQEKFQCGPAALTTALVHSGVEVSLREIGKKVFIPGREGSLQIELQAATRTSGRMPYVIDGTLSALAAELQAGRPVLVLQNLGVSLWPRWHYAVVIGMDPQRDEVILRSGIEPRHVTRLRTFLYTWRRGDYWAMVVLEPGEMPVDPNRARYFETVAAFEQTGGAAPAAAAWQAALQRWPSDPIALFGLANARYAGGELEAAAETYFDLLARYPETHAARNNLAMVLAKQGHFDEALQQIDLAVAAVSEPSLAATLTATRLAIVAMMGDTPTQ